MTFLALLPLTLQTQDKPQEKEKPKPNWAVVSTYAGSNTITDTSQFPPRSTTAPWSKDLNCGKWIQSGWYGNAPLGCEAASMGTVSTTVLWQGKGPAPRTVEVEIYALARARYDTSTPPAVTVNNGLGAFPQQYRLPNGALESTSESSKRIFLTVTDGKATLSSTVTARTFGVIRGYVAVQTDYSVTPK